MNLTVTDVGEQPSYYLIGKNMSDNESLNLVYEVKVENFTDFVATDECVEMRFVTPEEATAMHSWRNVKELAVLLKKVKGN